MSMGMPSEDQLRQNYQKFGDGRLLRIVHQSVTKLRPEAVEILKDEIIRRGMGESLVEDIEAQMNPPAEEKLLHICSLIQALPCPYCGLQKNKLSATEIQVVASNMIRVRYEKQLHIGCPDCLESKHAEARKRNTQRGWWGIPLGIAKTIQALMFNKKQVEDLKNEEITPVLRNYCTRYYGSIRALEGNEESLNELLSEAIPA